MLLPESIDEVARRSRRGGDPGGMVPFAASRRYGCDASEAAEQGYSVPGIFEYM